MLYSRALFLNICNYKYFNFAIYTEDISSINEDMKINFIFLNRIIIFLI